MLAKNTFILFMLILAVFSSNPQPIKAAEKVPDKATEKATDKQVDKPVDRPAEQPVYSNTISILPGVVLVIRDEKGFTSRNTLLSRYVKNEIYQFKLSIFDPFLNNLPQLLEYQILFLFQDKTNQKRVFQCESKINFKTLNFETPCQFKLAGNFKGFILAKFPIFNKNQNSPVSFQLTQDFVIKEGLQIPATSTAVAPKAEGLAMQIFDNKLQVVWTSNAPLTNITFTQTIKQKTATKQYLLSNNQNLFEPEPADFNDFDLGEVSVTISHALSKDGTFYQLNSAFGQKMTLKINAFPHQVSNNMNFFRYGADPVFRQSYKEGQTLQSNLIFDVNLGLSYYLLSPDNTIQKYSASLPKDKKNELWLEKGVELPIKLELKVPGAYMLTFVTANGRNYINIPFYVGSGFPLLPRYSDINKKYYQTAQDRIQAISKLISRTITQQKLIEPVASSPQADKKAYLLKLLNMFRNKHHASPLVEQKQLSQLAQVQAQNFIKNQGEKKKIELPKVEVGGQFFYIHNSLTLALLEMEEQLSMLEPIVNKLVSNVGVGVAEIGKPDSPDFAHLIYLTFGKQSPEKSVKASDSKLPEAVNIVSAATSNIRSQAGKQAAIKSP